MMHNLNIAFMAYELLFNDLLLRVRQVRTLLVGAMACSVMWTSIFRGVPQPPKKA